MGGENLPGLWWKENVSSYVTFSHIIGTHAQHLGLDKSEHKPKIACKMIGVVIGI